jgi:hypothetical protein
MFKQLLGGFFSLAILSACLSKPSLLQDPAKVTLVQFTTECVSKSSDFSIFCEAALATGVAQVIDSDTINFQRPSAESLYLGFVPDNASMEQFFKQKNLNKTSWLSSEDAKNFVSKHFVKGTNPWTDGASYKPPIEFELTTVAQTKLQVNWTTLTSATFKTGNSSAVYTESDGRLRELINPPKEEGWRQFRSLLVRAISGTLE